MFSRLIRRPSLQLLVLNTVLTWMIGLLAPSMWTLGLVGIGWMIFGGTIWYRLIKAGHFFIASVPIAFVGIIGVGVALPAQTLSDLIQPLSDLFIRLGSPLPASKCGHIFCFAILSMFVISIRHRLAVTAKEFLVFIVLLAIASEGIQLYVPIRTPSLSDFGLDMLGVGIGFWLLALAKGIVWIRQNYFRTSRKQAQPSH